MMMRDRLVALGVWKGLNNHDESISELANRYEWLLEAVGLKPSDVTESFIQECEQRCSYCGFPEAIGNHEH